MKGRLHPLAAFGHRLVGKTDDRHQQLAGRDHDLHFDRNAFYAVECNRRDTRHHEPPPNLTPETQATHAFCVSKCNLA